MALNRVAQSLRKPTLALRSKHKKLDENWADIKEPLKDGISYTVKYVGMAIVEHPKSEEMGGSGVKRILSTSKSSLTKAEKVIIDISPKGIKIKDATGSEIKEDIDVVRISYCCADKSNPKIFSFVSKNEKSDSLECRAYLCTSKKEAESVTLTVALAFKVAYELCDDETKEELQANATGDVHPNQDNKQTKIGTILSQIAELRKYQRLSSGSQHDVQVHENSTDKTFENEHSKEEPNPFNDDDSPKEISTNTMPVFETLNIPTTKTQSTEVQKPTSLKIASSPAIVSLMPPPKSGRNSPLRTRVSSTQLAKNYNESANSPVFAQPKKDNENWDSHFEQLAISRHKSSEDILKQDTMTIEAYPKTNPFSQVEPVANFNPFVVN